MRFNVPFTQSAPPHSHRMSHSHRVPHHIHTGCPIHTECPITFTQDFQDFTFAPKFAMIPLMLDSFSNGTGASSLIRKEQHKEKSFD